MPSNIIPRVGTYIYVLLSCCNIIILHCLKVKSEQLAIIFSFYGYIIFSGDVTGARRWACNNFLSLTSRCNVGHRPINDAMKVVGIELKSQKKIIQFPASTFRRCVRNFRYLPIGYGLCGLRCLISRTAISRGPRS